MAVWLLLLPITYMGFVHVKLMDAKTVSTFERIQHGH